MISDLFKNYKIILASQSPRRNELLKGLNVPFKVKVKKDITETVPPNLKAKDIALYLAKHKAISNSELLTNNTILITADTIVWHKNEVLNKPKSKNDAINILKKLSDSMHEVYTGVCISSNTKQILFYSKTKVWFRKLKNSEIKYYVENYKPFDKAGAYGVQEWIGYVAIEKIDGSFYNVMGLPIQKLYCELLKFIEK